MKVTEEALLASGFSSQEVQRIKHNIKIYGGDLEEAIQELRTIFRTMLWILIICVAVFICVCIFKEQRAIVAAGISLLAVIPVIIFVQPPVLAYKSWRYWRKYRANPGSAS